MKKMKTWSMVLLVAVMLLPQAVMAQDFTEKSTSIEGSRYELVLFEDSELINRKVYKFDKSTGALYLIIEKDEWNGTTTLFKWHLKEKVAPVVEPETDRKEGAINYQLFYLHFLSKINYIYLLNLKTGAVYRSFIDKEKTTWERIKEGED